ncbi:type I restriction enzyme HsdR N-terminal domain-containing protein [Thiospirillum jenense]|uniref:Type I restriction enzyme HsdR N-terminal domain-containing protein n=1 Tax=Thiospirillum jenense TaxID=1653858 RepID=A0A839HCZ7_9GAMM|nr:type I restriction enzyme HsdR N-terminal domain-containing protein [Thiospirillum jenense]MBB1125138.1 type I restriction enzyme HsdR N-terminal domain-containing protein [Thiospirillum jenense]
MTITLTQLLKGSDYTLTQFKPAQIEMLESSLIIKTGDGKAPIAYVTCVVRNKPIKLTPEEVVRQLYLLILRDELGYPAMRMAVEYEVTFGREKKRADICIFDKDKPEVPYILVEVKKPKLKDGKEQLKSYCNATGAPMGVWTNGEQISYYHRKDPNYFEDITAIPTAQQKLSDILQERWTLARLVKEDKLVNERKSLKDLILEMEDEVLANAGVDVFEELFKLVFTKLYDEWEGGRDPSRYLVFKNDGDTETELKAKMQALFDKAKKKWAGVFGKDVKIDLAPSHLAVCVASLEKVKLFNSNLEVIDEAFEYLINKSSKGEKGQYFTPRYVIDMCVKMLNPQAHETLIDPAAGSCGFPMHATFYVWEQILAAMGLEKSHLFTAERKPARCDDYVRDKVFAIDFDERAVRVGRTLNLIAGDGQTNVLHLNTLDYERWNEKTTDPAWIDIYNDGWRRLREQRVTDDDNRDFQFDLLMANPPFAGDIKETRILAKYELARSVTLTKIATVNPNDPNLIDATRRSPTFPEALHAPPAAIYHLADGSYRKVKIKPQNTLGRDILFIERNLNCLKPGGRMAIVLPQGRFNNASDQSVREYIAAQCRLLAVIGLHGNVFKPHTGTKTSVLLVQKWNDDPTAGALCPRQDDYAIFFATMREPSKDNSGDKIYRQLADGKPLLDQHGHLIVKHDLFNHDGLTEDGIAEAFIEFAKKEGLSFFELGSFNEAKYNALLEGLEISEIKLSELLNENDMLRIDAERYSQHVLRMLKHLRRDGLQLADVASSMHRRFVPASFGDFHYIEIGGIGSDGSITSECVLQCEAPSRATQMVKQDDVITSSVRPIRRITALIDEKQHHFVCSSGFIVLKSKTIAPELLFIYLRTEQICKLMDLHTTASMYPAISEADLLRLPIPKFSKTFEALIVEKVKHANQLRDAALKQNTQAESTLLAALGLNHWQPPDALTYTRNSQEVFAAGRWDAECYQPKYEDIKIRCFENAEYVKRIKEIQLHNSRGLQPEYVENGELNVINSGHILEHGLDYKNFEKTSSDNWDSKAKARVQKHDILIYTTGANIGRTQVYLSDERALASNHVNILRIENENPVYVAFVLNSKIGRLQTEQLSAGSAQQELYPKDIDSFYVPFIDAASQTQIADLIKQSFALKSQSEQLLESAKRAVEIAIETDEHSALEYLQQTLAPFN